MQYFNQFHKEKTERCLKKVQNWLASPMSSAEQEQAAQQMKEIFQAAQLM